VDLDDTITIATPEGIELRLQLAGLGSRFIAGAADLIIQLILLAILALVTQGVSGAGAVVLVLGAFVITVFYPILFELLAGGRTPGKRMTHLRVLRDSGAPVDLPASAIRNLMRLIDGPLLLYLPTVVSIAVTRRNQRPGDLAAGTIVTRENPVVVSARASPRGAAATANAERWDTSAVSAQEVAAVRRFLERREDLDLEARRRLAARLAEGLRPKVSSAPPNLAPERFLEELERIKRTR
jgi:uncharacterized RDD family membrane protein YckC